MEQGERRETRASANGGLRILMYGSPTSEPLLELMHRCGDGTVLFSDDRRVFDSLARFAPHLVVCDVQAFMDMRIAQDAQAPSGRHTSPRERIQEHHTRRQLPSLTDREMRVIDHVRKGFHNEEIARLLDLHPRTVKNVLSQLYLKLDVTNRTELIGSLFEQGETLAT